MVTAVPNLPSEFQAGRERNKRGRANGLIPVKSAERPTQPLLLIFHWLEVNQMSTPICKEGWKIQSFAGYIDIPPNQIQGFITKEKGENEFGIGNCPCGVVFPSKINTCLLR